MKNLRISFYVALSIIYFLPLLIVFKVTNLSTQLLVSLGIWTLVSLAILIYFFIFLDQKMRKEVSIQVSSRICQVEKKVFANQKSTHPPVSLKKVRLLVNELEEQGKNQKNLLTEIERLKGLKTHQEREYAHLNEDLHGQLGKKETILAEYRQTLKEQRKIIEKKQEEINILQIRLNDSKYEVENLLKLKKGGPVEKEIFSKPKIKEPVEELERRSGLMDSIQVKLDRYVKMAIKLNGARNFASQDFKYSDLSLGSLIIDQRRLFDRLQNEDSAAILVYSREERQMVFVNRCIKELLGWSPERFIKDFSFLIQKGQNQWAEALEDVKLDHQKSIRLLLKTRSGKDSLITCHLKEVPEGVFKGYVLGIFSSTTARS